jgi:DNA polymerase-3 subunit epsilon
MDVRFARMPRDIHLEHQLGDQQTLFDRFLHEVVRAKLENPIASRKQICTMLVATDYCRLPGSRGFKWPRLHELHSKLFGVPHQDSHQALADVEACRRCFFELKRLGIIS